MDTVIQIKDLEKSYGSHSVLKGVSFEVKKGEIFALLGTNGAGKTTTLECMEGLRRFDKGSIKVNGKLGVQLQSSSLPSNMKAWEAVTFYSKWQNTKVDKAYLQRIGVTPFLNKQYAMLSTGQKRRLHLSLALLGNPDIVVLDEPTAGLDVEGRAGLHEEFKRLRELGTTIILASHDMAEVEQLCDRLAVLKDGRIVFAGTPAAFTENIGDDFVLKVRFSKMPDCCNTNIVWEYDREQDYFTVRTKSIESALEDIIGVGREQDIAILDIKAEQADFEQRFLEIAREGAENI